MMMDRAEANRLHAMRGSLPMKIEEMLMEDGKLKVRVGKNWFTQKISATANVPAQIISVPQGAKNITIPSQSLNVRVSVSWE